ncbi:hypothetical protein F5B22DRAFT_645035 [Xylaria bambusicola]|uniref:uncharacterized protein n=1 Tax=Xylaria bambusicola TaxID=326684 RepID=UPI002008A81C|nr:uncharacterized protein F5B22DRAFT_645035 [Xylaria bambusicola]KAI0518270.1 hypothetical protein F5B22DRAFT_645035 [Xylaria bambusicola]
MSQNKSKPRDSKARDPPPSLFLRPSPSASHVSLSGVVAAGPGLPSAGLSTQQSQAPPPLSRTGSLLNPLNRPFPRLQTGDSTRTTDRTDALWAEMQATLEEAELSASGGTHVFGPDHDRKLAQLRAAQIALAQAWARSEADDAAGGPVVSETEVRNLKGALGEVGGMAAAVAASATQNSTIPSGVAKAAAEGTDTGKSTMGTGSAQPGNSGLDGEKLGAKLEEETERDILLARNRREANDRYFSKVDQGVRDVVAKLEEVAIAMRAVEQETRGVWGEESAVESADA